MKWLETIVFGLAIGVVVGVVEKRRGDARLVGTFHDELECDVILQDWIEDGYR